MANTFTKIASVTVGSGGASSIDFTSIPSTFTDLCVKVSARGSNTDGFTTPLFIRYNSNTSNYSNRIVFSNSSSAQSASNSYGVTSAGYCGETVGNSLTASTFSNTDIYTPNYAGSTNKSFSVDATSENNGTTSFTFGLALSANLWTNTAAISSVSLYLGSSVGNINFLQHSTAVLYGIKNS